MAQSITKKDLNEAFQQFGRQLDRRFGAINKRFDVTGKKIDGVEERLTESIRGVNSNFTKALANQEKRFEELLAAHHLSLTEAITEVILNDKLRVFESDLQQVKKRLTALENTR